MVGDSLRRDYEGARRSGMGFIWIAPEDVQAAERSAADRPASRRRDRAAGSSRHPDMTVAPESLALRGGIIAAGHGTRLRADGYRVSKPMTPVGGRPLIEPCS